MKWLLKHKIRLVLNLLAWLFLFDTTYNNSHMYTPPAGSTFIYYLHIILLNILHPAIIYINNFWLIPGLFLKRRYTRYTIVLLLYISVFSVIMSEYIRWLLHRFPGSEQHNFSSIALGQEGAHSWVHYYSNAAIGIFIMIFIFSIGLLAQKFFEISKQKDIIQRKQTEAELILLRSQINPHFLFNVLNSIYALSLKKSDQTPDVVLKLSEILRYMLYEARNETVGLEKELRVLQDYIGIEQMRLTGGQSLQVSLPEQIPDYGIAPVLLIPFVENAVKHGTDSMAEHAFIEINIAVTAGTLHFHCRNNYKKRPQQQDSGIGLDNVRKRLQLLYPGRHTLTINDKDPIFEVVLTLNLGS